MVESVLQHPTIGNIKGVIKVPGVTQLLGVQYATLADRFAPGVLLESYPADHARVRDGVLDATTVGPIPISPANGCSWEHSLIQQSLPSPEFEQNDTECLTLNIALPSKVASTSALPVLALVHGGAFATGSSSYPQYDLARIVQISIEQDQPIIAVGINYRLGVAGFLYSSAMAAAGYKPNNGLADQRLGFKWIRKHIAGFNGDPECVTFIGESAGAASGTFLMHSEEPLFSQFIGMSGSSLVKAKPMALAERSFAAALELLATDGAPVPSGGKAQVQRYLDASMEDIREKIGRKVPMAPLIDGDLIPRATTYAALADKREALKLFPGMKWCKRVLVGDCQMDGSAYAPRVSARADILPKTLADHLKATFDPINTSLAPAIISGYGLESTATANTPESLVAVLGLATDICFALGARAFARAWSDVGSETGTESFLYRFNKPNPWDGPWKGHATHILDIAFVLQNYRECLAPGQQKAGDRFTKDVISFVNGGSPWPAYKDGAEESAMVYFATEQGEKDESRIVPHETPETVDRRDIIQRLMKQEVFDKVMEAWEGFMKGPK
ncbi:hypothetical protein CcaverHIS641_0400030 [Cutaneotrichosporon cavernicola]|nr:hypothetical protein CcaverHIS641_0400030 [Cutaneotrichosporon cavernicola]